MDACDDENNDGDEDGWADDLDDPATLAAGLLLLGALDRDDEPDEVRPAHPMKRSEAFLLLLLVTIALLFGVALAW
jgi:hypothetical protein